MPVPCRPSARATLYWDGCRRISRLHRQHSRRWRDDARNKTTSAARGLCATCRLGGLGARDRAWNIILAGSLGVFLVWAVLARLDGAAVAPGIVSVETNRKTIQHLEGGIIRDLLVRDGDLVQAGQTLVRLDPTRG